MLIRFGKSSLGITGITGTFVYPKYPGALLRHHMGLSDSGMGPFTIIICDTFLSIFLGWCRVGWGGVGWDGCTDGLKELAVG